MLSNIHGKKINKYINKNNWKKKEKEKDRERKDVGKKNNEYDIL